jgi:hypothetical protein
MGHAVGLGTLWEDNGLYDANSDPGNYASGTHANDKWKAALLAVEEEVMMVRSTEGFVR